ncbi:hypothetical protein SS50377_28493 [Spironucleus salmonicida]|uniref:Uncharacterized protein n=1 Tax=Spironucleus salmonicida TaxID=348837 RepID=A0A9P8RUE1_9EUKA|nr:hypothetical protein SS50377_28493 [Spironucleus salmonicida]
MEQRIYIYKVYICENSFSSVYCLFMQICYVSEWSPGPELHEATMRTGISAVHREGLGAGNWDMQVHRKTPPESSLCTAALRLWGLLPRPTMLRNKCASQTAQHAPKNLRKVSPQGPH